MSNPCHRIGDLIERVTTSVKQFGILPHSPICVRIGDFGPEMEIEHIKVAGGAQGPYIIIQAKLK